MHYILVFGAVFVIMQAVILLFFFMISSAAEDVAGQIRKTFLKEMEVFDELYEEKSKKLKEVQEEYERFNSNILRKTEEKPKKEAARPVTAVSSMSDIPAARLVGRDFAQNYRSIRRSFCPDTESVLQTVAQMAAPDPDMLRYSTLLKGLDEKLTFDTVFNLTSLKAGDQEKVLRSVLTAEEQSLLDAFLAKKGTMDAVAFREWIHSELFLNNPEPVLYAGNADEIPQGRYTVHEEDSICEGVRVLQSGKMYDYSL